MSSARPRPPVVAIDGPAGSGKSTTARAVAAALGLPHLDSGALYRAVTLLALEQGQGPERWSPDALAALARSRGVALRRPDSSAAFEATVDGERLGDRIRSEAVNREVSRVAAMPAVRDFVNAQLRATAAGGGAVLDGRDIGTVVFPDAAVKVFLVADPGERARRRLLERRRTVDAASLEAETEALVRRDELDSSRAVAPLRPAPDAVRLDTTGLTFEEQVRAVVTLARRAVPSLDRAKNGG